MISFVNIKLADWLSRNMHLVAMKWRVCFIVGMSVYSVQAGASANESIGYTNGNPAASGVDAMSSISPFSAPKTLIVDNSLPNGTVLYSWDIYKFGVSFLYNFSAFSGSGDESLLKLGDGSTSRLLETKFIGPGISPIPTNNPGIGVKLYAEYGDQSQVCKNNCISSPLGNRLSMKIGPDGQSTAYRAYELNDSYYGYVAYAAVEIIEPSGKHAWQLETNRGLLYLRAELIKTGNVDYSAASTPIVFNQGTNVQYSINSLVKFSGFIGSVLGGGGINIIRPSCQLKTKDYIIPMSNWIAVGVGTRAPGWSLPAKGEEKPVDLSLECSGQVPNVRFKFEDAGSSVLTSKNISLYDSSGGAKINGLEIEMLYNGAHIDVDNSTETNVGTQGETKSTPADKSIFDSESTVKFTARFIQTTDITKNGNAYVGPVTGKVNMWITYD